MTHEEVLKKHGYKKQGSSNVFQHEGGHSVTVGQKGNWVHGKVIGGKNTEHTEGDSVSALDAHLGKFHWQRKTTHTNHDRKEILPVSEEPETSQHAEQSDVTQFTEQVLPTAAVVPAMQTSQQFSEPFSTFGSRLAASRKVTQFAEDEWTHDKFKQAAKEHTAALEKHKFYSDLHHGLERGTHTLKHASMMAGAYGDKATTKKHIADLYEKAKEDFHTASGIMSKANSWANKLSRKDN